MIHTSTSLEETRNIAEDFATNILPTEDKAVVVGLYGNLGAGKTTFVQALAKAFGLEENITSPTFVIEKIYELKDKKFIHFIHIDAYRLEKSEELLHLGWNDIVSDPKNLILIEWPEKVADIMPKHIKVSLKTLENENSRQIDIAM